MSSEFAIKVENVSKCYQIYDHPRDRLKQFILPRVRRLLGLQPKQYFREFWAVRDVSFEVRKGETVGIIGRNGSGKSTLLQMICGTLNPTTGAIQTNGRVAALLELGSGFNPEFTGRENVYMNGSVLGLSVAEIDARFADIVAFAEIGDFIDQPIKVYSSGMVVRLAFAVAVNCDPEVLVVDEALSVGDELFQRKCFSKIELIRARGATILFVSHSGAQVIDLCDKAVLLDAGETISVGAAKQVVGWYQRLLYAPASSRDYVRNQILGKSTTHGSLFADAECTAVTRGADDDWKDGGGFEEETFDPHFIPSATIEYESHGPVIGTPEILTDDGRKANGLIRGKRYRYRYNVVFHRSASTVRFGMSIKSATGLSLAGALSAPGWSSAVPFVEQGMTVEVEFGFFCNLNPGVYFMNAGVFGVTDEEEHVLHRRADVVAFRVLPVANNIETEMVGLGIKPLVKMSA